MREAEFLYEARLFPEVSYSFKHALTHDVAYGSLFVEQRKGVHRQIVDAIERLYPDRLAEQVERLADHAFRGEAWDKAVSYLRQAGAKAFARSANREAAAFFEQALVAQRHLPENRRTWSRELRFAWRCETRFGPWGVSRRASSISATPNKWPSRLGDRRKLGWIAAYMSEHTRQTGVATHAPAFAERALTIANALGDFQLRVAANYYLGTACFVAGEYRRTDQFFTTILELLKGERFRERCGLAGFPAVMSRMFWPLALAERGEFERGLAEAEEGVNLAEALDHPYSMVCAMRAVGRVHGAQGDYDRAIGYGSAASRFRANGIFHSCSRR